VANVIELMRAGPREARCRCPDAPPPRGLPYDVMTGLWLDPPRTARYGADPTLRAPRPPRAHPWRQFPDVLVDCRTFCCPSLGCSKGITVGERGAAILPNSSSSISPTALRRGSPDRRFSEPTKRRQAAMEHSVPTKDLASLIGRPKC
jgi:hypothetical protein